MNMNDKNYRKMVECGDLTVAQCTDYKWGVVDKAGNEIVAFGKYDWIDGFEHGLARVKIGKGERNNAGETDLWGIIDSEGNEVLHPYFAAIWRFYGTCRTSTRVEVYDEDELKVEYDFDLISHVLHQRISREGYYQQRREREKELRRQNQEQEEALRDTFEYLTEGMYGDYEDFNGSISDLREFLGYD